MVSNKMQISKRKLFLVMFVAAYVVLPLSLNSSFAVDTTPYSDLTFDQLKGENYLVVEGDVFVSDSSIRTLLAKEAHTTALNALSSDELFVTLAENPVVMFDGEVIIEAVDNPDHPNYGYYCVDLPKQRMNPDLSIVVQSTTEDVDINDVYPDIKEEIGDDITYSLLAHGGSPVKHDYNTTDNAIYLKEAYNFTTIFDSTIAQYLYVTEARTYSNYNSTIYAYYVGSSSFTWNASDTDANNAHKVTIENQYDPISKDLWYRLDLNAPNTTFKYVARVCVDEMVADDISMLQFDLNWDFRDTRYLSGKLTLNGKTSTSGWLSTIPEFIGNDDYTDTVVEGWESTNTLINQFYTTVANQYFDGVNNFIDYSFDKTEWETVTSKEFSRAIFEDFIDASSSASIQNVIITPTNRDAVEVTRITSGLRRIHVCVKMAAPTLADGYRNQIDDGSSIPTVSDQTSTTAATTTAAYDTRGTSTSRTEVDMTGDVCTYASDEIPADTVNHAVTTPTCTQSIDMDEAKKTISTNTILIIGVAIASCAVAGAVGFAVIKSGAFAR